MYRTFLIILLFVSCENEQPLPMKENKSTAATFMTEDEFKVFRKDFKNTGKTYLGNPRDFDILSNYPPPVSVPSHLKYVYLKWLYIGCEDYFSCSFPFYNWGKGKLGEIKSSAYDKGMKLAKSYEEEIKGK